MTKEEKAFKYADGKSSSPVFRDNHINDFLAGYEAAESNNNEMMCKFAEWVKSATLRADGLLIFSTPQQILTKFKESLKQ